MPTIIETATHRVPSNKIYTKSFYARKIKKSHTQVNRMIDNNELMSIKFKGVELVCKPKDAIAV